MGTQPLWTSSIKFEPLRKKYQSADTNTHVCLTPQKKRKDQRMLMHTTPRKRLFQPPSEILVHRGVRILNGMALCSGGVDNSDNLSLSSIYTGTNRSSR
jgi:hypothetical protein